jgi:hypothetical protein
MILNVAWGIEAASFFAAGRDLNPAPQQKRYSREPDHEQSERSEWERTVQSPTLISLSRSNINRAREESESGMFPLTLISLSRSHSRSVTGHAQNSVLIKLNNFFATSWPWYEILNKKNGDVLPPPFYNIALLHYIKPTLSDNARHYLCNSL